MEGAQAFFLEPKVNDDAGDAVVYDETERESQSKLLLIPESESKTVELPVGASNLVNNHDTPNDQTKRELQFTLLPPEPEHRGDRPGKCLGCDRRLRRGHVLQPRRTRAARWRFG